MEKSSVIAAPRERVFAFYDDPDNLAKITPPGISVELLSRPERPGAGARVRLRIKRGLFSATWEAVFAIYDPPRRFVDEQKRGPFRRFRHEHRFEEAPDDATRMTDAIDYEPPFGPLGWIANALFVERELRAMLDYRHEKTRELLESKES
jgi:ligand-binding SRPBCC domain-containing protein